MVGIAGNIGQRVVEEDRNRAARLAHAGGQRRRQPAQLGREQAIAGAPRQRRADRGVLGANRVVAAVGVQPADAQVAARLEGRIAAPARQGQRGAGGLERAGRLATAPLDLGNLELELDLLVERRAVGRQPEVVQREVEIAVLAGQLGDPAHQGAVLAGVGLRQRVGGISQGTAENRRRARPRWRRPGTSATPARRRRARGSGGPSRRPGPRHQRPANRRAPARRGGGIRGGRRR